MSDPSIPNLVFLVQATVQAPQAVQLVQLVKGRVLRHLLQLPARGLRPTIVVDRGPMFQPNYKIGEAIMQEKFRHDFLAR